MRIVRPLVLPVLLLMPAVARAQLEEQKKQPPPEFTWYRPPGMVTPGPRADVFGYLDVAVLVGVLLLVAYLVLAKRSRRDLRVVTVFSLLYFGFYRQGCVCAVGAIQNVALALGDNGYALPFAVGAFFLIPLLAALFFGRVFCAAVCPLGAIQDLVVYRPRRVPGWLDHMLGLLPYIYLGAGVLFAATGSLFLVCQYDPFISFFRLGGPTGVVLFGVALLIVGTVVGRPYCRYLCPYGVLLRWVAPFARWQVRITPTTCVQCHLCADACPFGAIRPPTPEPTAGGRLAARRRMARLVAAVPVLVVLGAGLGWLAGPALAHLDRNVALADRVWAEEQGRVRGMTDASIAFHNRGLPNEVAYRKGLAARQRFVLGATLLGGWMGLVVGLKMVFLSVRRRRVDYEADPAACVTCARCYASCPVEHDRLGETTELSEAAR